MRSKGDQYRWTEDWEEQGKTLGGDDQERDMRLKWRGEDRIGKKLE